MSNSDHLVQGNLRFNVLTHKQKESLHTAVLHILSNVGIRLYSDEALRLLGDAGAFVDINNKLAKINVSKGPVFSVLERFAGWN